MNFDKFHFSPLLAANLKALGFETPTPIQTQAIPVISKGHDVVGLAQTGTGKTAAFVLPILQKLSDGPRHKLRALIIGPTRELAEQTNKVIHDLGNHTKLHSVAVYGGVSMRAQVDGIRRGAEIVVACPGRLLDHLRQGTVKLNDVEVLVLDEADQMFDMGFLPDVRQIIRVLPENCQKLLFSATMPAEIRKLAHDILKTPETIQIEHTVPLATVAHAIFPVSQHLKGALLIELLKRTDAGPVLVFTRTRHRAKRLAFQLEREGFKSTSIQGNLSQSQRQRAMEGFRSGRIQILVATDIAARGIDVTGISHVINFDIPDSVDAYTHRIGRTGRAAQTGDAYTLVTREDKSLVVQIERALKAPLERKYLEGFDYDAAAPERTHHQEHDRGPSPGHRPAAQSRGPRRQQGGHQGGHHAAPHKASHAAPRSAEPRSDDAQPAENTLSHRTPPQGKPFRKFAGAYQKSRPQAQRVYGR
ncbi:MAG: DEAD/DEAH box helicase [bacterium]